MLLNVRESQTLRCSVSANAVSRRTCLELTHFWRRYKPWSSVAARMIITEKIARLCLFHTADYRVVSLEISCGKFPENC